MIRTLLCLLALPLLAHAQTVPFEEAVHDVGNVGLTVTNAGFVGEANVRNNPTGPPSFEYPLDSGVEHLFEAGLWIGIDREVGGPTVRTGAVTDPAGYAPGKSGFEFAPLTGIERRSSLETSPFFTREAVSQQDFVSTFTDTLRFVPGSSQPLPGFVDRIGAVVEAKSYAWGFPFTEFFVIYEVDIVNASEAAWDSVYVGMWADLVTRNVNTTTEGGGAFFNKGGLGYLDSLTTTYAFNAGGQEQTLNTYGAMSILGAEWNDPNRPGSDRRFFYPTVAESYLADGYPAPTVIPRFWQFTGNAGPLARPSNDGGGEDGRYGRMARPFPNPDQFAGCDGLRDLDCTDPAYLAQRDAFFERIQTDGQNAAGNYISLLSTGPFPSVAAGDTLTVTFAWVGALKPEFAQGQEGKPLDTPQTRENLRTNVGFARFTYAGEDQDYDGELDPGEDVNGNNRLDRYLIPEPPRSPDVRVVFEPVVNPETGREEPRTFVYWDDSAELSRDPVTGEQDFEGYRVYRSDPGDDRRGNLLGEAQIVATFDTPGNESGLNNGFDAIRLDEPVTIDGQTYHYRYDAGRLLSGWQYLFAVTAFDRGDARTGLPSFESGLTANAQRVFPGDVAGEGAREVGVYPNPYRLNAAWDGGTARTRRLNFTGLPARADIRVYTMRGQIVAEMRHEGTEGGDIRWYDDFSTDERRVASGEHSWDLLSENSLDVATGLYFFTVEDLDSGEVHRGKFVVVK